MNRFANYTEHLLLELHRLMLMLRLEVARMRSANLLTDDDFRGLYVSDAQVDALLQVPELWMPDHASQPEAEQVTAPTPSSPEGRRKGHRVSSDLENASVDSED